jgi:LacI family transcriptional regulator
LGIVKDAHVTLHDVAARAGVSVATASRALTGTKVNKKNHAKVQKAAAELGYVPNEAARSLRNVRTMTVGVVFSQINSPLSTEVLDALASGLDEKGYSLFVATAQGLEERFDTLTHRFLERRVDALLCINPSGEGTAMARYFAARIPVVALFSKAGGYDKLPLIASSVKEASKDCIARLQALGHQTIGILRPNRRSRPIEAFREHARKAGLAVRTYDTTEGAVDAVGLLNSMTSEAQRPTAVVARQGDAVRLFEAADEMGVIVPRMLSIIAIRDRTQQMPVTRLPLSMIHLNPGKIGVEAAEILVGVLAGERSFAGDVSVETGAWIERATLGPAPTRSLSQAG